MKLRATGKSMVVGALLGLGTLLLFAFARSGAAPEVELTVLSGMERIGQDQALFGERQAHIKAARNEVESFQVVVGAPQEAIRVVRAELSDFSGPAGTIGQEHIDLFREEYVRVRRSTPRAKLPPGLYTDPLVPFVHPQTGAPIEPLRQTRERWGQPMVTTGVDMYAVPFDVWAGQNQPIWVDVTIPEEAAAGEYSATFSVTLEDSSVFSLPVSLTVWDFTLPDGPTHRNHFGGVRSVARHFGIEPNSERYREIELRYLQMMADHRLNPALPASLLPEVNADGSLKIDPARHQALMKFLKDLHVTDFEIPRFPLGRRSEATTTNRDKALRYYRDYYRYLEENGWAERAYLYMYDEPNLPENYEEVLALAEVVHEAAPELEVLVVEQPYKHEASWPDINPAVDIWCPLWGFIDRESIEKVLAEGDEVWSYTALAQRAPLYHPRYEEVKGLDPPYWHIDQSLTQYRIPTWLNWQYKISGLLYWTAVSTYHEGSWYNPAFVHGSRGDHFNGGGLLMYPGVPSGIDGPVASMRLKNLRDAMEDYEYFVLLEKLAGREAVTEIVNELAPEWWNVSQDPEAFRAARERLALEILRRKA